MARLPNPIGALGWAGIITGVTAAVAGGVYAVTRKPKAKKKKKALVPKSESDCATLYGVGTPAYDQCLIDLGLEKPPRGGPPPAQNYVGSGWDWPRKDEFPDQSTFGFALAALGYEVGDFDAPTFKVTSQLVMAAVKNFQRDYNIVKNSSTLFGLPVPDFLKRGDLDEDGLIGKNTIDALIDALRYQNEGDSTWADAVREAKEQVA